MRGVDGKIELDAPLIDDFRVLVLDEVTELLLSTQNHVAHLTNQLGPFLRGFGCIPLGQTHFALSADKQHEIDLHTTI